MGVVIGFTGKTVITEEDGQATTEEVQAQVRKEEPLSDENYSGTEDNGDLYFLGQKLCQKCRACNGSAANPESPKDPCPRCCGSGSEYTEAGKAFASFFAVVWDQWQGHRHMKDQLKEALYQDYLARLTSNNTQH